MIRVFAFLSSPLCANVVAILAFLIGAYNFLKMRAPLDVRFAPDLHVLPVRDIYLEGKNNVLKVPVVFSGFIEVINPSPHDVAFFDLRVFNPETNIKYGIMTKKTFPDMFADTRVQVEIDGLLINQEIPARSSGIFRAHSFTPLDILIFGYEGQEIEEFITLSFKISKRRMFRKAPYSLIREKYQSYGIEYHLSGWKEVLDGKLTGTYYDAERKNNETQDGK